jgi:prevent-host-death family protein
LGRQTGQNAMKHVNLSEARAHLAELLDEVERGETLVISRDGETTAAAEDEALRERQRQAMRELRELRKQNKPVSVEEILAWKNEGRA